VLASFELLPSGPADEEQAAPAREEEPLRRMHLRNKGGLTLRASGVLVLRRDIGDESADVDIATTDGSPASNTSPLATSLPPPAEPSSTVNSKMRSPRSTRPRRPPSIRAPATPAKIKVHAQTNQPPKSEKRPVAKKEKPKSETYKQAWSISEQHLLERLLSEIPDGEKNR